MKCSNCGKEVPFAGNVCPFCNADKSKDQQTQVLATVLGVVGALAGAKFFGLWGSLGGFAIGIATGVIAVAKSKQPPK